MATRHGNGRRAEFQATLAAMPGRRFGRLVVCALAGKTAAGNALCKCKCDCGKERTCVASVVLKGKIQSCGCLQREKRQTGFGRTHGMKGRPEHYLWCAMKARCSDPKNKRWDRYGGRGIRVCERWLHSFQAFYEDMGARPSPKHMLDRIAVDGNYEPGNVRWVTATESCNNRTSNHRLTFNGKTLSVADWARETGMNQATLRYRVRSGWDVARALTTPVVRP